MFYQTYTARKAAEITPGSDEMVPSAAAWRHLQRARSIPSLAGSRKWASRFFVPGDLDLWPLTLTFNLVRARDKTRLPCEFGAIRFQPFPRYLRHKQKKTKTYRQR